MREFFNKIAPQRTINQITGAAISFKIAAGLNVKLPSTTVLDMSNEVSKNEYISIPKIERITTRPEKAPLLILSNVKPIVVDKKAITIHIRDAWNVSI